MLAWMARAMCRLLQVFHDSTNKDRITLVPHEQAVLPIQKPPLLPPDIFFDILVRLPATSIRRLKSVSKQWLEIVSDPHFEESHLVHEPMEFDLIHCLIGNSNGKYTFFFENFRSSCFEMRKLPFFFENFRLTSSEIRKLPLKTRVHGSCKGLILIEWNASFSVANPITWQQLRLPPLNIKFITRHRSANIGFDFCSNEYKVVVVDFDGNRMWSYVLTLQLWHGTSAWRSEYLFFPGGLHMFNKTPLFTRQGWHWIHSNVIFSIDLTQEKLLQQTNLTFSCSSLEYDDNILIEWDGCLAVIPKYQMLPSYNVFVLRESVWTSELQVDVAFFKRMCPSEVFGQTPPYPVASFRDGKVIIFKDMDDHTRFYKYNLLHHVMTPFTAKVPRGRQIYLQNGYFVSGSIIVHVDYMDLW